MKQRWPALRGIEDGGHLLVGPVVVPRAGTAAVLSLGSRELGLVTRAHDVGAGSARELGEASDRSAGLRTRGARSTRAAPGRYRSTTSRLGRWTAPPSDQPSSKGAAASDVHRIVRSAPSGALVVVTPPRSWCTPLLPPVAPPSSQGARGPRRSRRSPPWPRPPSSPGEPARLPPRPPPRRAPTSRSSSPAARARRRDSAVSGAPSRGSWQPRCPGGRRRPAPSPTARSRPVRASSRAPRTSPPRCGAGSRSAPARSSSSAACRSAPPSSASSRRGRPAAWADGPYPPGRPIASPRWSSSATRWAASACRSTSSSRRSGAARGTTAPRSTTSAAVWSPPSRAGTRRTSPAGRRARAPPSPRPSWRPPTRRCPGTPRAGGRRRQPLTDPALSPAMR